MAKKKQEIKIDYDKRIKELEDYKVVVEQQGKDWNKLFEISGATPDWYFDDMKVELDKEIRNLVIERYEKEKR